MLYCCLEVRFCFMAIMEEISEEGGRRGNVQGHRLDIEPMLSDSIPSISEAEFEARY